MESEVDRLSAAGGDCGGMCESKYAETRESMSGDVSFVTTGRLKLVRKFGEGAERRRALAGLEGCWDT